jgi:hypothetical protein
MKCQIIGVQVIKNLIILMSFIYLSGCVYVGFDKGPYHNKSVKFDQSKRNGNIVFRINKSIEVSFQNFQCGYYGLLGIFIVPFIPYWKNTDCNDLIVEASGLNNSNIYLNHKDYTYSPYKTNPKLYYYTFPVPVKSLSDGAILVIEKDGERFEIPFRYQHSFSFQLWGT